MAIADRLVGEAFVGVWAAMVATERAPAAPTLEQLRRGTPWCWVVSEHCLHRKPAANGTKVVASEKRPLDGRLGCT